MGISRYIDRCCYGSIFFLICCGNLNVELGLTMHMCFKHSNLHSTCISLWSQQYTLNLYDRKIFLINLVIFETFSLSQWKVLNVHVVGFHLQLTDFGLSKVGLINSTDDLSGPTVGGASLMEEITKHHKASDQPQQRERRQQRSAVGTPDYLAPEILLGTSHGNFLVFGVMALVSFWNVMGVIVEFIIWACVHSGSILFGDYLAPFYL